jgi:2-enoate reductase
VNPDVVFVASGASPVVPEIEGIKSGMDKGRVFSAVDVLLGKGRVGDTVAVIGGGSIGCETALHLAKQGKRLSVIEILDTVAHDMVWGNALDLVKLLDDNKVEILTRSIPVRITETGLDLVDPKGRGSTVKADNPTAAPWWTSYGTRCRKSSLSATA